MRPRRPARPAPGRRPAARRLRARRKRARQACARRNPAALRRRACSTGAGSGSGSGSAFATASASTIAATAASAIAVGAASAGATSAGENDGDTVCSAAWTSRSTSRSCFLRENEMSFFRNDCFSAFGSAGGVGSRRLWTCRTRSPSSGTTASPPSARAPAWAAGARPRELLGLAERLSSGRSFFGRDPAGFGYLPAFGSDAPAPSAPSRPSAPSAPSACARTRSPSSTATASARRRLPGARTGSGATGLRRVGLRLAPERDLLLPDRVAHAQLPAIRSAGVACSCNAGAVCSGCACGDAFGAFGAFNVSSAPRRPCRPARGCPRAGRAGSSATARRRR